MLINVSRQEFAYLKIQRGDIDHLSGDYPRWLAAYREKLEETYVMVEPHLPARCDLLLDIGSGLGGIDVLLCKHYAEKLGKIPRVHLLDGDGAPQMQQHCLPFSNMSLAVNFLQRHGVRQVSFSTPQRFVEVGKFDLIVSFSAWCFHIPVASYLDYVLDHSHNEAVFIVDARRPLVVDELRKYFLVRTIQCGKKYDRIVMKKRAA
jgi:SAM-dependent methyltransferase